MIKNIDPVLDARNIIYGLAFIAFLPLLILIMMYFLDSGIKWDGVTFGIIGYFLSLSGLSVYAAVLCGKKKKMGRIIA